MATFGNITAGGSVKVTEANGFMGSRFTLSEAGSVESITVNLRGYAAGYTFKGLLCTNADPAVILAVGQAQTIPSDDYAWATSAMSTSFLASTGTYILGYVCGLYTACRYTAGTTGQTVVEADNNLTTPTNPTGLTSSDEQLSIYATYTPSTGAWQGSSPSYHVTGYFSSSYYSYGNGIRFPAVTIPAGVTIADARITFTANTTRSTGTVNSRFTGYDVDDAAIFSTTVDYQARRGTIVDGANDDYITAAQVDWDNIGAWTAEQTYQSPDLSTIVQEIVNRGSWASGNDMAFFWDDHDDRSSHVDGACRSAYTYIGSPTKAPALYVSWVGEGGTLETQSWGVIIG